MQTHTQYGTAWYSCYYVSRDGQYACEHVSILKLVSRSRCFSPLGSIKNRFLLQDSLEMSGRNICGSGSEPGLRVPPQGTWDVFYTLSNTEPKFPVNILKNLFCTACSLHWKWTKYSLFVNQNQPKTEGISLQMSLIVPSYMLHFHKNFCL
jgi:hypothetical protein